MLTSCSPRAGIRGAREYLVHRVSLRVGVHISVALGEKVLPPRFVWSQRAPRPRRSLSASNVQSSWRKTPVVRCVNWLGSMVKILFLTIVLETITSSDTLR